MQFELPCSLVVYLKSWLCACSGFKTDDHKLLTGKLFFSNHVPLILILQQMKSQRDKVKQYQKQIARKLETERRIAKELVAAGKKE